MLTVFNDKQHSNQSYIDKQPTGDQNILTLSILQHTPCAGKNLIFIIQLKSCDYAV